MKVVLLAGGAGTRLMELTRDCPKPLVTIGDMPIIWHVMKTFAAFGHNEFINAGYMVLEPDVFDYLGEAPGSFELGPIERLTAADQLAAYVHDGFWQCMDTLRERTFLDELVREGCAPWLRWD